MFFRAIAGMVAGLCAGAISGAMFIFMTVPQVDGGFRSILTMLSRAVGADDPSIGWSYHLFSSTMVGVLFGVLLGRLVGRLFPSVILGLLFELVFWAVGIYFLMPTLTGMHDWRLALNNGQFQPFMVGTFIGSLIQGVLMGVFFTWVYRPIYIEEKRAKKTVYRVPKKPLAPNRSRPRQPSR